MTSSSFTTKIHYCLLFDYEICTHNIVYTPVTFCDFYPMLLHCDNKTPFLISFAFGLMNIHYLSRYSNRKAETILASSNRKKSEQETCHIDDSLTEKPIKV